MRGILHILIVFSGILLVFSGCKGTPPWELERQIPLNASFDLRIAASLTSPDDVYSGDLHITNTETLESYTEEFSLMIDPTTFTVEVWRTIILAPGVYDFTFVVSNGSRSYAGYALLQTIEDDTNLVPFVIKPIFGEVLTDVTMVYDMADLVFQFDPAKLTGFTDPRLGLILNGGAEEFFTLDPQTGTAEQVYANLAEGPHTLRVNFYDGAFLRGRSVPENEDIVFTPGTDLLLSIVPPVVVIPTSLVEGGDALFQFQVPGEVIEEAGGLGDLRTLFSVVGIQSQNTLQEAWLTLAPNGFDFYGSVNLAGFVFGEVVMGVTFFDANGTPADASDDEMIGNCIVEGVNLDLIPRTTLCGLVLRRRAVVGGNLMATLAVNVANSQFEPTAGAVVRANGKAMGITGTQAFGTPGYLKLFMKAGYYTMEAQDQTAIGSSNVDLAPLSLNNLQIIMDTPTQ